jgi:hypothetical protein
LVETSDIRKRLLHTIQRVRREASARRAAVDAAQQPYQRFLSEIATPVVKQFANVLRGEGLGFTVFTPADSVRLSADRSGDDYIELVLDTSRSEPAVNGRTSFRRGSRTIANERPVREGASVEGLTAEDVVRFLLEEIEPFIER